MLLNHLQQGKFQDIKLQRQWTFSNSSQNRFPETSRARLSQMSSGQSYRRWQTDGGDSESRACGECGYAVSPEEEEEEVTLLPSFLGTRGGLEPWKGTKNRMKDIQMSSFISRHPFNAERIHNLCNSTQIWWLMLRLFWSTPKCVAQPKSVAVTLIIPNHHTFQDVASIMTKFPCFRSLGRMFRGTVGAPNCYNKVQ